MDLTLRSWTRPASTACPFVGQRAVIADMPTCAGRNVLSPSRGRPLDTVGTVRAVFGSPGDRAYGFICAILTLPCPYCGAVGDPSETGHDKRTYWGVLACVYL